MQEIYVSLYIRLFSALVLYSILTCLQVRQLFMTAYVNIDNIGYCTVHVEIQDGPEKAKFQCSIQMQLLKKRYRQNI